MMLIMMMEYRSQLISLKSSGVFSSETHDSAGREVVRDASGRSDGLAGLETAVLESAGSLALCLPPSGRCH
jgi:hypothetical protein